MTDIFEDIKKRLDKIDLSENERELLLKHEKITKKELEVNGKKYDAWRIIHNNALGLGKGGIRFHPGVNEDEVKSLSFWMSLKTSLMGIPLGGGKGGVSVDVLVLAALENQVTLENADKINAKYILELANGPVTYDADEILFSKGIKVIPDILANAGGGVVSYFEWDINRGAREFDQDKLNEEFNEIMTGSFEMVYDLGEEKKISLRDASYELAIERILEAERDRGNLE